MFVRARVSRCIAEFFHTATKRTPGASAALVLGLLATLSPASLLASTKVPDWVKTAADQTLPRYPASTKAVVLFEDTTYTVAPNGKAVEHYRSVIKILRPQGRDYAYPAVWFDKDSKVNSMHVWSIDPAGHEYAVNDSDITERGTSGEGGILFDDEREKIADPPGRQRALRGDDDSIRHALRTSLEGDIPKTMQVKVDTIDNMENYEQPLKIHFTVNGTLGSILGKRLVLPVELFRAQSTATFPNPTRTQAVYFDYPEYDKDAIRVNFPPGMTVEAAPSDSHFLMRKIGLYDLTITPAANNITIRRTFAFNDILVLKDAYPDLRSFYSQFEAKDHESVVLKNTATATATPAAAPSPAGN